MRLSRYLLPVSWRRKLEWMLMNPKPPVAVPRRVRMDLTPSVVRSEPLHQERLSRSVRHRPNESPQWISPAISSFSGSPLIYSPPKPFVTPEDDLDTWIKTPPITVHPLLREGRIIWDLREEPHMTIINQPPFLIPTPLYLSANVAEQAVLCKGITHVSIFLGDRAIRPLERAWGPITLTAFQGKEVLVVDILRAIYSHFHQKLTKSEMRIFSSDPALAATLERERNKRCTATGKTHDVHYRRCDLLEGLCNFEKLYFNSISGRECRLHLKLKRK